MTWYLSNKVLKPVSLTLHLQKTPFKLQKANCHKSNYVVTVEMIFKNFWREQAKEIYI